MNMATSRQHKATLKQRKGSIQSLEINSGSHSQSSIGSTDGTTTPTLHLSNNILASNKNSSGSTPSTPSSSPLVPCPPDSSSPSSLGLPTTWFSKRADDDPLIVYKAELNVVWWLVMVLGAVVRGWRLDYPCYVVFDEVHFGKFASYYLQRTFFFDVHPPLGKMMFALVGYAGGYDGTFLFPSIGLEFPLTVPYVLMRGVSVLSGTCLIACVYEIMIELGFSHKSATLASLFTIFDNSLIVQSRVIMLDSLLIFFTYLSVLSYLKFYHHREHPFSPAWHRSLAITGISLGCLLGIKYTGILGLACVGLLVLCDLWQLIGDHTLSIWALFQHTLLRGVYLLGIPLAINISLFYLHFLMLSQAGPGNAFVSPAFRNSLEGTVQLTPTMRLSNNATLVRYGSSFTLRSAELTCWLHSHNHTYPLKYPDGRGSSYQQQVTCYDFRDVNNFWTIRKSGSYQNVTMVMNDSPVRNGDMIELVHDRTNKLLNSHDVAAPLTPALQEVAGYINYSAQFIPYLQWQLDVPGLETKEPVFWEKGKLKFKLKHVHSKQILASTGKRLPADWGFQQYEVVTDRVLEGPHVTWGVEDLRPPNISQTTGNISRKEEEQEIRESLSRHFLEGVVSGSEDGNQLSFWDKYLEIQEHMANAHSSLGDHTFASPPQNWPMMGKTLPYWLDEKSNAQVTLLGNPLLWWLSTAAIHVFLLLTTLYLMRFRRACFDLKKGEFHQWWTSGCVLVVGWLVHYLPYYLLSRVLFLHHYLPALPFKFMVLSAICDHTYLWARKLTSFSVLFLPLYYFFISFLLIAVIASYLTFAPFTYGYPALSLEQINWRVWVDTWDLLHRSSP